MIRFSTMHAFKGLERKVVLAVDLVDLGDARFGPLYYVGLSRARTLLELFIPSASRGAYEELARQFGARLIG